MQGWLSIVVMVALGAGFALPTGRNALRIDVSLKNALNQSYADYLSRIKTNAPNPGMGRTFVAKLSTDF